MRCCSIVKRISVCAVFVAQAVYAMGDDLKTVKSSYTYYATPEMSVTNAKREALNRAMERALADEFGMLVTQSTATVVSDKNGDSETKFISTGQSELRGEWIETIGEPDYKIGYSEGLLVVEVAVKGKARKIDFSRAMFSVSTLRKDKTALYATSSFNDGDIMCLDFEAPSTGFVAAYLVDAVGENAYRLLPYSLATNNPVTVDGGKLYRFFDRSRADNPAVVDEVELTCEDLLELNDLYILYSPTEFQLPAVDNGNGYEIKNLSLKNFHKWLSASRTHNHEIQLKTIHITIQNQQK